MACILAELRRQTNGAVAGAMEERGVVWPLNYGVSVPAIRQVATQYAPDHALGKLLYVQQVRELCVAGIMVADPAEITADELSFWADNVFNTEIAEHLSFLLAPSRVLNVIADEWLNSDNEWLRYAAILSITRRIISDRAASGTYEDKVLDVFTAQLSVDCRPLWRSCAAFVNALYKFSPNRRVRIEEIVDSLSRAQGPAARYLAGELWLDSGV